MTLTPPIKQFDASIKFLCFVLFFKVIPPTVYLRVTENVHHIVPFIERIIENGNGYVTKEGEGLKLFFHPSSETSW